MSIARITEVSVESKKSFDDAIETGIKRANETLDNITGAWVKDQSVVVENGKIKAYRVMLKVTFVLKEKKAKKAPAKKTAAKKTTTKSSAKKK
jgi:flavin-binding protein dodecin